jgi:hypothetical protein
MCSGRYPSAHTCHKMHVEKCPGVLGEPRANYGKWAYWCCVAHEVVGGAWVEARELARQNSEDPNLIVHPPLRGWASTPCEHLE